MKEGTNSWNWEMNDQTGFEMTQMLQNFLGTNGLETSGSRSTQPSGTFFCVNFLSSTDSRRAGCPLLEKNEH